MTFKTVTTLAAMILIFASSTPVSAASIEQIGCIADEVGVDEISYMAGRFFDKSQRTEAISDLGVFEPAINTCTQRFNWTQADATNSAIYAISFGMATDSANRLDGYDVRLDVLDAYVAENYETWKSTGLEGMKNRNQLVTLMEAAGVPFSGSREEGPVRDMVMYLLASYLKMRAIEAFESGVALDTKSLG